MRFINVILLLLLLNQFKSAIQTARPNTLVTFATIPRVIC